MFGYIEVLCNAIFLEIGPPRNAAANNIEHYTFVTLFSRKSDTPHPHLRYVTLEWPLWSFLGTNKMVQLAEFGCNNTRGNAGRGERSWPSG